MNYIETFQFLGHAHAGTYEPKRLDDINMLLPYFEIFKNDMGKYDIKGYNYEKHDNAPRMALWEHYMRAKILGHIRAANTDIKGFYNIELHDSYTYLDNNKNYTDCFTFSKFKDSKGRGGPVLIPDPYAMMAWGGELNSIHDTQPWSTKKNKACFYGTTTGNRDPSKNERINTCIWSLKHRDLLDFKITKIAQMPESMFREYVDGVGGGGGVGIYSPALKSLEEQMQYKYHLVMDGNTCRFDIWNYLTNSVTLKYTSKDVLWYYPLLLHDTHYVEVDQTNMLRCMNMSDAQANYIISNARNLMSKIASPINHELYLISLFEQIAWNRS